MVDQQLPSTREKSFGERLGLGGEPGRAAPYLRVALSFLKELGEEQLKQIPGVGPAITALLELSREEDSRKLERRVQSLLVSTEQTREDIELVAGMLAVMMSCQKELLRRFESQGHLANSEQLTEFATGAALLVYCERISLDCTYIDYRGIQGASHPDRITSLLMDDVYVVPRLVRQASRFERLEREHGLLNNLEDPTLPRRAGYGCRENTQPFLKRNGVPRSVMVEGVQARRLGTPATQ